jgi:hypothetical protein
VRVGQATLSFQRGDSAVLEYQCDHSDVADAFAALSGSINLSKIGACPAP